MDYDELVNDIVKGVHARYDDYVEYRKSNGLVVDSFDEVVEQLLDDDLFIIIKCGRLLSIPVTILVHCSMTEQQHLMVQRLMRRSAIAALIS